MALSKLGDYIELSYLKNSSDEYGESDVVGISTQKETITTKANLDGIKLTNYKQLPPNHFAFVPDTSRRGDKMSLAFNNSQRTHLVSSISVVFRVIPDNGCLLSDYLYIYFKRAEFDRYARFNSWGSAREAFSWDDMCDIDIDLPPIEIQQKYVDVYDAMVLNQKAYEQGLEDLKLTCDAYIERLREEHSCVKINEYIEEVDEKAGNDETLTNVKGISINKEFIITKAKMEGVSLSKYKVVRSGQFAFNINTARMGEKLAIALCEEDYCLVSAIYEVFKTNDNLLPEYLMMWLKRTEFDRYVRFHSWGSAREVFTFKEICDVQIPIPQPDLQQSIVDIYRAYLTRREINEKMKAQIKDLCPILIKGSIEEAQKAEASW